MPRSALISLVVTLIVVSAGRAEARCDVTASATALADARAAIDAACPCGLAEKPSAYVKCAKPVIAARIENQLLDKACKGEALKHATKSTCGRPGAVVCCRVSTSGHTSHKIAKEAGKCVDTPKITTCISDFQSVPTGCTPTGCAPECGNDVVESGETCDSPDGIECDQTCQLITCELPPTSCGNGSIDVGEACDPPGVEACGRDCQLATCAAAGPGEIAIACVDGEADVGAGSEGSSYLVAWTAKHRRDEPDLLARRFDLDAVPVDAAAYVVSTDTPCGTSSSQPAVASSANGYLLAWSELGQTEFSYSYRDIDARPLAANGTLGALERLVRKASFGQCQSLVDGPAAAAAVAPDVYDVLWRDIAFCIFGPALEDPNGMLLDYAGGPAARTVIDVGFPFTPEVVTQSAATTASSGGDTLAVWHADFATMPQPPYDYEPYVVGAWIDLDGTSSAFTLSSRRSQIAGTRPGIAAGAASFLTAWAQGATDMATDATEIRAMRVTPGGGGLDPDGGLLLATTAGAVLGGPAVAFDGSVWLVVWSEVAIGGAELRAVAVNADGTLVDLTPRLLASGLDDSDPAVASAGEGRVLAVYVKTDGAASAVRATLVPGQ